MISGTFRHFLGVWNRADGCTYHFQAELSSQEYIFQKMLVYCYFPVY